jgi:hypothetical protein
MFKRVTAHLFGDQQCASLLTNLDQQRVTLLTSQLLPSPTSTNERLLFNY